MTKKYSFELGKWEKYLNDEIETKKSILISLIDPEKMFNLNISPEDCAKLAYYACEAGVSANMIGGSTGVTEVLMNNYARPIRRLIKEKGLNVPLIGFPASHSNIAMELDAIWFMSLLNSRDPYYVIGAQVQGAPIVKRYGIEPIPMAYIVVEPGGVAAHIGKADPIPRNKPELAVGYGLAAQYSGKRFVYLEAGSGAEESVPNEMISAVKKVVEIKVGTGGGIKTPQQAMEKAASGADFIIVGTEIEKLVKKTPREIKESIGEMVEAVREGASKRKL